MRQPRFVCLLIRFHFFLLMLSLCLGRKPGLDLVAKKKGSPYRVGTGLAFLELLVDGAFGLSHGELMIVESLRGHSCFRQSLAKMESQASAPRDVFPPTPPGPEGSNGNGLFRVQWSAGA